MPYPALPSHEWRPHCVTTTTTQPTGNEDWRYWPPTYEERSSAWDADYTITIPAGQTSAAGGRVLIYGDRRVETDEYFWWEITGVEGPAGMPSGDAAWGKAIIVDDDFNPPPPAVCGQGGTGNCVTVEDLPWRVTAENVGLSRPADSIIVGLPVTFYFENVKTSCLPDAPPAPYEGTAGTTSGRLTTAFRPSGRTPGLSGRPTGTAAWRGARSKRTV